MRAYNLLFPKFAFPNNLQFSSYGVPFNILNDIFNDYPFSSISAFRDADGKLRRVGASRWRRAMLEPDEPTTVKNEDTQVDHIQKIMRAGPGI